MSGKSGKVMRLPLRERARVDPVKALQLRRELGPPGAERLMRSQVRRLTVLLMRMEALRHPAPSAREEEEFRRLGARMAGLAAEIGLVRIARVAGDVVALSAGADEPSAAAAWARLLRLCAAVSGPPEAGIRRSG